MVYFLRLRNQKELLDWVSFLLFYLGLLFIQQIFISALYN